MLLTSFRRNDSLGRKIRLSMGRIPNGMRPCQVASMLPSDAILTDCSILNNYIIESYILPTMTALLPALAKIMGINPHKAAHHRFVNEMEEQFRSFVREITIENTENQVRINVQNGTLTLTEGIVEVLPHDKKHFLTYALPYAYDTEAKCPRFQRFLDDVLPLDLQRIIQEYFAYMLLPHINLRKALFLYGSGANGKSVLIKILSAVLGRENVAERTLEGLCANDSRSVPDLEGKLLIVCGEMSAKFDIAKFKSLVVGDPVDARRLYSEVYTIYNYGKLLISCNELPRQIEHTDAFFKRLLIVPFLRHFTEEEQDPLLASKIIKEELPGILNWGLEALPRLLEQQHFSRCETAENALTEYKEEIDSVASYIKDFDYQQSNDNLMSLKVLFEEYLAYCKETNCYSCNRSNFSRRLKMLGYKNVRRAEGCVFFIEKKIPEITPPTDNTHSTYLTAEEFWKSFTVNL